MYYIYFSLLPNVTLKTNLHNIFTFKLKSVPAFIWQSAKKLYNPILLNTTAMWQCWCELCNIHEGVLAGGISLASGDICSSATGYALAPTMGQLRPAPAIMLAEVLIIGVGRSGLRSRFGFPASQAQTAHPLPLFLHILHSYKLTNGEQVHLN